jgi:hypothetical protein
MIELVAKVEIEGVLPDAKHAELLGQDRLVSTMPMPPEGRAGIDQLDPASCVTNTKELYSFASTAWPRRTQVVADGQSIASKASW